MKIIKNLEDYNNFAEILKDAARVFSNKDFLIEGGKEYSFSQFNKLINKCSRLLLKEGVNKGDIVSIILKNSVDYLLIYFAALKLGCKINPFPFHMGTGEIKEKLNFINPKIVYTHAFHADGLAANGLKIKIIQADTGDILGDTLKEFSEDELDWGEIDPDEPAFMYYSSGTTGSPKIIEYSTRSEILTMASLMRSSFIEAGSTHICMLPLGHTAAIRYSIMPCLLTGSKVILFESFWKIRNKLWEIVREFKATFFEVVPSILIAILNTPYENFDRAEIASLKFIGCGSAYLPKNLQDKFEEKFGIPVANMYGLSETGPTHFDNPFVPGRKTGTVGEPLDIMDVKIFDENGKEVETGKSGEFAVKGPSLLRGYYKNQEQYDACFLSGYFLTGDIGYQDEKGIFYYVDRKKDLIIKGGINIVPSQIDELLLTHGCIEEAATVGAPDMFFGETIKSYIVLKKGKNVGAKELGLYCKEHLGDFKTPSKFEFIDELPKGPSGKILKRKLKELEKIR